VKSRFLGGFNASKLQLESANVKFLLHKRRRSGLGCESLIEAVVTFGRAPKISLAIKPDATSPFSSIGPSGKHIFIKATILFVFALWAFTASGLPDEPSEENPVFPGYLFEASRLRYERILAAARRAIIEATPKERPANKRINDRNFSIWRREFAS